MSRPARETDMSENKESSVLFSLKELMSLEEDRIKQEDDDRRRREEAEQQARLDAERRARDAEEARMRAEEDRRRAEEQRQREESTRLDAIRHGEVERARAEAENQARLAAMRQQQEHEQKLTALTQDKKKKQLVYIAVGIGATLILALVGGGFALKSNMDEAARVQAAKDAEIKEKEGQLTKLMAELKAQNEAVAAAQAEASSAKTEAERQAAQAKLAAAQDAQRKTQGNISRVQSRPTGGGGGGPAKPKCTPGDPMCTDL